MPFQKTVFSTVVIAFVLCSFGAAQGRNPDTRLAFYIPSYLDCTENECRNAWGECFRPVYDGEGVADVDMMPPAPCYRDRNDVLAVRR